MRRTRGRGAATAVSRPLAWLAVVLLIALGAWLQRDGSAPAPGGNATASDTSLARVDATRALPAFLPPEAHATLQRIARGGPHPHPQDGSVFGNREGRLPAQPRGYYREYTVDTPGLDHRGARRIVTGGQPPRDYYYTDDHYDSFRSFELGR